MLLCGSPLAATGVEREITLTAGQTKVALDARLQFHLEGGEPLAEKIRLFLDGAFDPSLAEAARDGAPYQPVWGAVTLINGTPDDGREGDPWHVASEIFGLVALDLFVIRDSGLTETILSYDARAPFDQSEYNGVRLRSSAFLLAPEESALLMAKMAFGPVASADLMLETPVEMDAQSFFSGISLTAFYAFSLSCLLFFFGFSLSMRSSVGVGYSALLMLGLALVAYQDGLSFRFLYPNAPAAHVPVGIAILFALSAAGFWVAGHSVDATSDRHRLASGFRRAGLLFAVAIPLTLVVAAEIMAPVSYIAAVLMFGAHAVAVLNWRRVEGRFTTVMRALSWVCAAAAAALVVLLFAGRLGGAVDPGILIKALYAVIGGWIIFGVTIALVDLRRQHAEATEGALTAARREADATRDLLETEQNYNRARDLAALRQRQLATASHDLKQPIMSLRLTMDSITKGQDPAVRDRLTEAFDYMESLSAGYLDETTPDDAAETPPSEAEPQEQEPYPLNLIFDTVAQMFREEAISKGVNLRKVACSARTDAPVMAIMRIISNLVSNAVKYTTEGKVLLGARRRPDGLDILICDTGVGMTNAQIAEFTSAYRKGAQSDGTGLGLSICFELAEANGLHLSVRSTPGEGSVFTLWLRHAVE